MKKKIVTVVLSIVLIFSSLPLCALNASALSSLYTYSIKNGAAVITGINSPFVASGKLTIPSTIDGYSVNSIGASAFSYSNISELIVPNNVKSIDSNAFYNCSSLQKVTIGTGLTDVGSSAFSGCVNLKQVYITSIAQWCKIRFEDNTSNPLYYPVELYLVDRRITDLEIPESVTSVSQYAFAGDCKINSITIPAKIDNMGKYAFSNNNISAAIIGGPTESWGYKQYFVGEYAFYGCDNLENITIGENITHINDYAFAYCEKLKKLVIGESVSFFGDDAFYNCMSLDEIYITNLTQWCMMICGNMYSHPLRYANNLYYNGEKITDLKVPDSVERIGPFAFFNCDTISSVTIPESVEKIDYAAFSHCDNITDVTMPNNVQIINDSAFEDCIKLKTINLPKKLIEIGKDAFSGCESITTINIPDSVVSIGEGAFRFTDFKSINVDEKNLNYKFENGVLFDKNKNVLIKYLKSNSASSYEIPSSVTSIEAFAFEDCDNLNEVYISKNVQSIGKMAFNNCTNLKHVMISKNSKMSNIGNMAFIDCKNLSHVWYGDNKNSKQNINIGFENNYLEKAAWHYNTCDTTHNYRGSCDSTCDSCEWVRETTAKHNYKPTITKATLSKNGEIVKKCTVCGTVASSTAIKYAKTFKLSTTTYTYNGKVKTPTVTVKDSAGKTLKMNTDYTVTYASGRKNAGTYKVTVKMKGNYTGTKTLTFKINPAKTTVSKLTAGKKRITVAITKKSTQVTGYQVQYSTSKTFSKATAKTISSYKTTKYTLKSLNAKKTYYVRVRTYKTVGKTKYYSGWSTYKKVKTK